MLRKHYLLDDFVKKKKRDFFQLFLFCDVITGSPPHTWYVNILTNLSSIPYALLHHLCSCEMEKKQDNPELSDV